MRRRVAIFGVFAVLVALAGCSAILGPGEPDQERLNENATYDWETNATVTLDVNRSSYTGIYNVSNETTLELYDRDALGREHHVDISALRYRYGNGTVVRSNESESLSVDQTRQRTTLTLPNESGGHVAFTAPRHGKTFTTPVFIEGSYEVQMPANARVGVPLLSQVSPGSYNTSVEGERMTVRWDEVTSQHLRVRWYLERDLLLFSAVFGIAVAIGGGGALYYYRQIQRARKRREEAGFDIDTDDDDPRDRGPPPGMR